MDADAKKNNIAWIECLRNSSEISPEMFKYESIVFYKHESLEA